MLKSLLATSILFFAGIVHADQMATMTCTAPNVVLTASSPYFGDGPSAKYAQRLYVIKSKDAGSGMEAYFLNVTEDVGPSTTIMFGGRNEVGGTFDLRLRPFKQNEDSLFTDESTVGSLTYRQGPLRGNTVPVTCTLN